MKFLILAILIIAFSFFERYLKISKEEIWDKYKFYLLGFGLLIFFLLAYYVTDSFLGLVFVFALILFLTLFGKIKQFKSGELGRMFFYIFALPFITLLMMKSLNYLLIDFRILFLLIYSTTMILAYPNREKQSMKESIFLLLGAFISIYLIYSLSNGPNKDYILLTRQEVALKEYVEEKYGENESYFYISKGNLNLRGDEIEVAVYGMKNKSVKAIYKNGEIIEESAYNN